MLVKHAWRVDVFHDKGQIDIIDLKYEILPSFYLVKAIFFIRIYHSGINRGALKPLFESHPRQRIVQHYPILSEKPCKIMAFLFHSLPVSPR